MDRPPSEIKQPRRILVLGKTLQNTEPVLKVLTQGGSPGSSSAVKSSAECPVHQITTPYFSASVPVWTDEVGDLDKWATQWRSEDGAGDVVRAIGAWIVCFTKPTNKEGKDSLSNLLSTVSRVISHHLSSTATDYSLDYLDITDIVTLAIAVPHPSSRIENTSPSSAQTQDTEAEIEEICQTATGGEDHALGTGLGWEYVDGTIGTGSKLRNEFGEVLGMDRLLDALKAGEWDSGQDAGPDDEADKSQSFGFEELSDDTEDGAETNPISSEDDVFGEFKTATAGAVFDDQTGRPNTSLTFEDDFTDFSHEGQGASFSRATEGMEQAAAEVEGDNVINKERAREMRASLLLNAEDVARQEGAEQLQQAAARSANSSSDPKITASDSDDPWRVRGKGPHGPERNETSILRNAGLEADEVDDDDVEHLQNMMLKLQAARDLGADLPAAQRKQLAARAVREVMREI